MIRSALGNEAAPMNDPRNVVAMLIERSRAARRHLNLHVHDRELHHEYPQHWYALTLHLTAAWNEAHRAAELARRILYRDDQRRLEALLCQLIAADRACENDTTAAALAELTTAQTQFAAFLEYCNEL
jgi:hypothetical protein